MPDPRPLFSPRLQQPPPTEDQSLQQWLLDVHDAVNLLPAFSAFSVTTPNSSVTAKPGTIGVNEASATTLLWLKLTGVGNTGWVSLSTA